jgi:hypothetical protein
MESRNHSQTGPNRKAKGVGKKIVPKMKFRNLLIATITVLSLAFTSSCSKEDRIEKNLWNKGGDWNIESVTINQTSTDPIDNYSETIPNPGSFLFKEDGSGIATFTADGDTEILPFTYSNTEDKLILTIDGETRPFEMTWEKNEIELAITENYTANGATITYKENYSLKKK